MKLILFVLLLSGCAAPAYYWPLSPEPQRYQRQRVPPAPVVVVPARPAVKPEKSEATAPLPTPESKRKPCVTAEGQAMVISRDPTCE